ncbi:LEA family epithelial adhesin, partial [Limosilactobacillus reuteri]|uniref:LEA family epithelial adhesin n=1 Tax=Limosilactobacillus reuteri TaxID=1598 RepID=UPI001EE13E30
MMKRPEFLETKRTPRYSLRKLNVGVASVLLGVTIFGINFTDHSVKAATTEKVQQTTTQEETSATGEVQRSSGSNTATANNSIEAATTLQSAPNTQGSADTDIRSLTAISAAKLATMNLMQNGTDTDGNAAGTPGTGDRSAAVTVNPDNINTQPAKENQKLANEHNLSSSDNYSSNIYKGTDGKYYKIVTIYGNDYVYRAADIQASGANLLGRPKQTAEDIKNNINISKEDLGNGKTRWTVVFFPNKGLQNYHDTLHGLSNAKFGIALTSDYQIVGNVDMDVISDPKQSFVSHTFKDNSNSATNIPVQNPSPEVKFSFNPKTDVDENTGLINSKTMPAYNNKYLQGPYYFTTATSAGTNNLWQTYFKDADERKNAYDYTTPYLGGNHDFHVNTFKIANETGVDGAKYGDSIIYDKRGGVNGVFNSVNFNQAMEFKSQGFTGNGQSQFSSYKISFTTQHTDSHEVELTTGSKNQQFSGISANIYSFQNGYYSMMSSLYGEQRALDPAGATVEAKKIIPHWGDVKPYMDKIKQNYLNNAQINVLRNKILNNITDPDALNNIVSEGNSLNDAMKKLGNSIGQYDSDGSFADHKEDTTKASDRYKYASPDKKAAYDKATEVTKALINKDTGDYADQATVEKLTTDENNAWSALDGVKPTDADKTTPSVPATDAEQHKPKVPKTKEPVANTSSLTETEKAKVKKNVEDANKGNFPTGTTVEVGADGTTKVTYPDHSKDTIPGDQLVQGQKGSTTDAGNITPTVPGGKVTVKDPSHLTDDEKKQVKSNVDNANKDKFPAGTTVTVGADGTATVTYPDGSKDTIPGDQLVQGQKGSTTDAGNITPTVPGGKVTVKDPSHLTDDEKKQVKNNVDNANKDKFPAGTTVTVGADGTATVTYPDGSKDTIPGDQLVQGQKGDTTDAGNITPNIPGGKVTVKDPSHLTDDEKNQVKNNVDNANKDKFPAGTEVTVGDDGTATVTYPDGSKDTIPGDQLVQGQKGSTTDAGNITPTVPGDKVTVKDPSHLTDDEKKQVKNNVDNANKDKFPAGTEVTVGDDGTATVTYPDGSKDTIPGDQLVQGQKGDTTD